MSKTRTVIQILFIILFAGNGLLLSADESGILTIETLEKRTHLKSGWRYQEGDNRSYSLPEFDDSGWKTINLPRMQFEYASSGNFYLWLRKRIFIADSLKGKYLGLVMGKLPDTAVIYMNGHIVGKSGSMPPDHYYGNPAIPRSYIISDGLIRYGEENVLAVRAYSERSGVHLFAPFITNELDRTNAYAREYIINTLIPLIMVFVSIIVSGYFLLMFIRNKDEKYNIYIFLGLICLALYSTILAIDYLPFPLILIHKIQYSALFLVPMFFSFYMQDFFGIHKDWRIKLGIGIYAVISCIILFFARTFSQTMFFIYGVFYLSLLAPYNFYALFLNIMAVKKKRQYAKVLLVGISLILVTAFHDMFYSSVVRAEPIMWFTNSGLFLFIISLFVTAANRFVDTKKKVEKLNIELMQQKNAFFRFVPTQFLALLGKSSAVDITLGDSSLRSMSVLFSDIRKFTSLAESMNPEASFRLLNRYLLRMETSIMQNDGFVDKYIGDAIMALFSEVPGSTERKSSADRAICAAIQMRRQLEDFNRHQRSSNLEILKMGIGINTGPLMLGTVGSSHRLDTTVIGDSVNLASRLEQLTRYYKAGILISDYTLKLLSRPDEILIRELDSVLVKGKKRPVIVYEIFDSDPEELKEMKIKTRDSLITGLIQYKAKKFKEALEIFKEVKHKSPDDVLPVLYMKRCLEFIKKPPGDDWNGVYIHLKKYSV